MEDVREDAGAEEAPKKKGSLMPVLIIIVGVVVVAVAVGMFMLRGGNKSTEPVVEGRGEVGAGGQAYPAVERMQPDPYYYFENEFKVNTADGGFVSTRIVLKLEDYYIAAPAAGRRPGGGGEAGGHEGGEAAAPEETAPRGLLAEQIDRNLPSIRDFIIRQFNQMTAAEIRSEEGKQRFTAAVIDYINNLLSGSAGRVLELYFEELITA